MPRAQDRRVLKTKRSFAQPLTGLLEKKPLQEITVKELLRGMQHQQGDVLPALSGCARPAG